MKVLRVPSEAPERFLLGKILIIKTLRLGPKFLGVQLAVSCIRITLKLMPGAREKLNESLSNCTSSKDLCSGLSY